MKCTMTIVLASLSIYLFPLFTSISTMKAQVQEREGTFTKHEPNGYQVEGKAYLVKFTDTIKLRFGSNFNNPEPGPDLDVYLSSGADLQGANSVRIAPLKSNSGLQSYVMPDSIGFQDYDYVIIYCTQYDHEWAQAKLSNNQDSTNDDTNDDTLTSAQPHLQSASPKMSAVRAWRQNKTQAFQVYDLNGRQVLGDRSIRSLSQLQQGQMYLIRYQLIGQDRWYTDKVVINR